MLEWEAMQMAMNTTADVVVAAALVADVDAVDDAAAAEPLVAATHSHLRSPIQNQSWRPPYAQIREAEEELQKLKSLEQQEPQMLRSAVKNLYLLKLHLLAVHQELVHLTAIAQYQTIC